jgi:hypothetical protein
MDTVTADHNPQGTPNTTAFAKLFAVLILPPMVEHFGFD